jgi:hypothetical protein
MNGEINDSHSIGRGKEQRSEVRAELQFFFRKDSVGRPH